MDKEKTSPYDLDKIFLLEGKKALCFLSHLILATGIICIISLKQNITITLARFKKKCKHGFVQKMNLGQKKTSNVNSIMHRGIRNERFVFLLKFYLLKNINILLVSCNSHKSQSIKKLRS